MQLAEIRVHLP